jgi:feruloyl esterase
MAPGMAHCSGGDGLDSFGQGPDRKEGDGDHDLLKALEGWRETGHAPAAIIASKLDAQGSTIATRPLCAYPQKPVYRGGDAKDARSFQCTASPGAKFERPAAAYLH